MSIAISTGIAVVAMLIVFFTKLGSNIPKKGEIVALVWSVGATTIFMFMTTFTNGWHKDIEMNAVFICIYWVFQTILFIFCIGPIWGWKDKE